LAIVDVRVQVGTIPIWGTQFSEGHLRRMMEKYGISRCVVSSTKASTCDFISGNDAVSQLAGKGGIYGCAVVNTQYPPQSIEDMRRRMSSPAFVALLIRSGLPNKPVTLDECSEILNAFRRYAKVVMIEASNREGVLAADEIARAFGGLKFVLLSMGGAAWRTAIDVADKTLNLVLEVSGSLNPDKIRLAVERVGAHRMVFGTNMPIYDPSITVGLVEGADISDVDRRLIFEGTANRLFGWASRESSE